MVRPNGFEPSARSLGNCCSIHLSYGRVRIYCTKSHSRCKDWLIFPLKYRLIRHRDAVLREPMLRR